jgi:membrane associated rhomboid family serine protease
MIPLKDNLRYVSFAWVSVVFFAINTLVYIGQTTLDSTGTLQSLMSHWLPVREVMKEALTTGDPVLIGKCVVALFGSMFMHGSFGHFIGNMCFFFCFAPALEARMGHARFAVFYLLAGLAAAGAFLVTDVSGTGHIVGASGAIGGVLGAYVIYFPRARIDGLGPTFNVITTLGAFILAEYMLMQWVAIFFQTAASAGQSAGVAFWAHIGGMVFGMVVAAVMAVHDVGRLKRKDLAFYVASAAVAAVSAFYLPRAGGMPLWAALACGGAMVSAIYGWMFGKPFKAFWTWLGTPLTTMVVLSLTVLAADRSIAAWNDGQGVFQILNIGAVSISLMVATIIAAIAARRLPVVVKLKVTVPVPKPEDRLLSETVVDLVVGFCRFVVTSTSRGITALVAISVRAYELARDTLARRQIYETTNTNNNG